MQGITDRDEPSSGARKTSAHGEVRRDQRSESDCTLSEQRSAQMSHTKPDDPNCSIQQLYYTMAVEAEAYDPFADLPMMYEAELMVDEIRN